MALVRAGAAFDADVHEHLQRAVFAEHFAEFVDEGLFPAFDQLTVTRETKLLLEFCFGQEWSAMRHDAFHHGRNHGEFMRFRNFEISHYSMFLTMLCVVSALLSVSAVFSFKFCTPGRQVAHFARVVYLVAGWSKEQARCM